MRRFVINSLAIVGALTLVSILAGFVTRAVRGNTFGTVVGSDDRPLAHVPVFLNRGHRTIERFLTDSAGRIRLPLADKDLPRAAWLICAPGASPIIVRPEPDEQLSVTYRPHALGEATWSEYRAWGWHGPIPRECPPSRAEPFLWAYSVPGAVTEQEPEWPTPSPPASSARQLPDER